MPKTNDLLAVIQQKLSQANCQSAVSSVDAGVLLLISDESVPRLLFSRRSAKLRHHAGEVSLVGGKKDDTDSDIVHTILREVYEEVALQSQHASIIGCLPYATARSGLSVCPLVAIMDKMAIHQLYPAENEIDRLFWVSLDYFLTNAPQDYRFLLDAQNRTHDPRQFAGGTPIVSYLHTPAWVVDGEVIWGMTARIVASFLQIVFDRHIHWYYHVRPYSDR